MMSTYRGIQTQKINPLIDVPRASGGFIFMPVFIFEKLISRRRFKGKGYRCGFIWRGIYVLLKITSTTITMPLLTTTTYSYSFYNATIYCLNQTYAAHAGFFWYWLSHKKDILLNEFFYMSLA